MKKFLALLAATILFAMTACGGSRKTHSPSVPGKIEKPATEKPVTKTPQPTEPDLTQAPSENKKGTDTEFKDVMDKYEALIDEYCTFMKSTPIREIP